MQKRTTILAIILIVIVAVVMILGRSGHGDLIDKSIDTPDAAVKVYLEAMIPHHQEAVDASQKIIQDPAITDTELKIMAGRIYDAQTFEIVQMKSWYSDWFGTAYNASSTLWKGTYMPMMLETRVALDPSGLKKAYIKEMIVHHKMAIGMSKEAKKAVEKFQKNESASDGTLTISDANPLFDQAKGFMQRVIDVQSKEIEQLSSLRD